MMIDRKTTRRAAYTTPRHGLARYQPQRITTYDATPRRSFGWLIVAVLSLVTGAVVVWPRPATVSGPVPLALPTAVVTNNPPLVVTVPDMPVLERVEYKPEPQPAPVREPMPAPPAVWIPNPPAPVAPVVSQPPVAAEPPTQPEAPIQAVPPVAVVPPVSEPPSEPQTLAPRVVAAPNPASLERAPVVVAGSAHHGVRPQAGCLNCHPVPATPACATCKPVPSSLKEAK